MCSSSFSNNICILKLVKIYHLTCCISNSCVMPFIRYGSRSSYVLIVYIPCLMICLSYGASCIVLLDIWVSFGTYMSEVILNPIQKKNGVRISAAQEISSLSYHLLSFNNPYIQVLQPFGLGNCQFHYLYSIHCTTLI